MRKHCNKILIVLTFVLFLTACGQNSANIKNQDKIYFGKEELISESFKDTDKIKETPNYVVYEKTISESYNVLYWYKLFDGKQNIVLEGKTEWKEPEIKQDGNIISVTLNAGTLANQTYFYNTASDQLSEKYDNILSQNGELICYYETDSLIIANAFDKSLFYKEIKRDYKDNPMPIYSVEFIDDETIELSYYSADKTGNIVTENISLSK